MMTKVFIDGSSGTTGLRVHERLQDRRDIELVRLPESLRKDADARKKALNEADIAFLCLPDAASVEAVSLIDTDTAVIDTSTAFRTSDDWVYGFPELKGQKEKIIKSKRIANPGCHASGVISLIAPLVDKGLIKNDAEISCFSLTGYSGGGKKMIEEYETSNNALLLSPRMYGIAQHHKHIPEIMKVCGLRKQPAFCPIVSNYYSGMEVTIPLFDVNKEEIASAYQEYYQNKIIKFVKDADESGFIASNAFSGRDDMQITVCGTDENALLVSRFDNLGKGASGSAIQNMNLLIGIEETTGLNGEW